jgi:hypothetical protein
MLKQQFDLKPTRRQKPSYQPGVQKTYVKVVSTGFWENFSEVDDSALEGGTTSQLLLKEGFNLTEDV